MLDLFNTYLKNVEKAVSELEEVIIERYEEEILADDRANLRNRIRFTKGHLLEINEAIIYTKNEIKQIVASIEKELSVLLNQTLVSGKEDASGQEDILMI